MKLMHIYQVIKIAICFAWMPAHGYEWQFVGALVAKGSGLKISIPRINGAVPHEWPMPSSMEVGHSFSPLFQEFFICKNLICSRERTIDVTVNLKKISEPIPTEDSVREQYLRSYVSSIIERSTIETPKLELFYKKALPRLLPQTLTVTKISGVTWVSIKRETNGQLSGIVYWRGIGRDYIISASYDAKIVELPKDIRAEDLNMQMLRFVELIKIEEAN